MRLIRGRSKAHKAGVTVRDTASEARMDTMYATAKGVKMRPSIPCRAKRGRKTSTTSTVA